MAGKFEIGDDSVPTWKSMSAEHEEEGGGPPRKKQRSDVAGDGENGEGERAAPEALERSRAPGHDIHLHEEDVGISEYVSSHGGFFAILKQRYSDFIVHELSQKGDVVQLTKFSLPIESNKFDADEGELVELLGAASSSSIKELAESADKESELKIKIDLDKGQRTLLHKTVRGLYPYLETETLQDEESNKFIVFRHTSGKNNKSVSRGLWPRERGSYCRFVLHKTNTDTMEAVSVLSRLLKIKSSCFHFAGTKDKRAVTSQLVTAFKVTAQKLQALNTKLRNMKIGNYEYVPEQLKLGDLTGNRFTIVLRSVSGDDHMISAAVRSLREAGFINYFGMQRFGTSSIPTHHIGRCLIHSDWKGAIDLILKPRPGENEVVELARDYYHTHGDARGTISMLPKSRYIERLLLQGLEKHGPTHNYLGAFQFIPRNTRLLYLHSWQSYCWNYLVSWRIRNMGFHPAPGDLVWGDEEGGVTHLTEEDKGAYDICDVLLPLPGYDIQLPHNQVKEEYLKLLKDEGVSLDSLKNKVQDVSLPGSYRRIVLKPKDVKCETYLYDDYTFPLVLTDADLLTTGSSPPVSLPGAALKALKLEFTLPPSSYATMAIRELIKMETSSSFQATLNEEGVSTSHDQ